MSRIGNLLARLRGSSNAEGLLGACLGALELRVLESLWSRAGESAVRGVAADLPGTAYTTVMTTLDRLYKKGLLDRRKDGRAFLYSARYRREEVEAMLARDAIDDLLRESGGSDPVLVGFVEAVGERDARMLDELERLVRRYKEGGPA